MHFPTIVSAALLAALPLSVQAAPEKFRLGAVAQKAGVSVSKEPMNVAESGAGPGPLNLFLPSSKSDNFPGSRFSIVNGNLHSTFPDYNGGTFNVEITHLKKGDFIAFNESNARNLGIAFNAQGRLAVKGNAAVWSVCGGDIAIGSAEAGCKAVYLIKKPLP